MAFCINCGQALAEGAQFCANCGKAVNDNNSATQRKTTYDGQICKCPNCGDILDAYETVCDVCGFEIRGRKTTSVVHELSLKLEHTDDVQKKDELIRTFYIPNTKEDIHEFFILALSYIKIGGMNTNSWMVKLEQAYQKAELSFNNTQEFDRLKILYEKACAMNKRNSTLSFIRGLGKFFKSGYAWALLFTVIGLFFILIDMAFESETLTYIGVYSILGAMWIAIMTLLNSDGRRKNNR